jgi:hypothetical protein
LLLLLFDFSTCAERTIERALLGDGDEVVGGYGRITLSGDDDDDVLYCVFFTRRMVGRRMLCDCAVKIFHNSSSYFFFARPLLVRFAWRRVAQPSPHFYFFLYLFYFALTLRIYLYLYVERWGIYTACFFFFFPFLYHHITLYLIRIHTVLIRFSLPFLCVLSG